MDQPLQHILSFHTVCTHFLSFYTVCTAHPHLPYALHRTSSASIPSAPLSLGFFSRISLAPSLAPFRTSPASIPSTSPALPQLLYAVPHILGFYTVWTHILSVYTVCTAFAVPHILYAVPHIPSVYTVPCFTSHRERVRDAGQPPPPLTPPAAFALPPPSPPFPSCLGTFPLSHAPSEAGLQATYKAL
jgi:hypothetical protein